ncbi:BCL2 modifying factor 2 [Dunckerocampus dactyliophorus]|uniref:BCL2 modifying factor 2 n=1 Tax=Dunckerocampus dactyliophorus TaxID=161453 RepID=UPI0024053A40|nr:BCL2 modifying factor 2 [Dunckerocampus dactyliophorus]
MDDEEEDMSRPISQLWGTPFRDGKYEDPATQLQSRRARSAVSVAAPTPQSLNNNSINALACSLQRQPRVPFHGLRSHFPSPFEPLEDRGERRAEEEERRRQEEDDRMGGRPGEQAGVSVETQIGQKLREIGDKFQQDHIELFLRHQRQNLPAWMRLTMALFGFLFPRQPPIPRLRGEER